MKFKNLWLIIGAALVVLVIVVSLIPDPPNPAEFKDERDVPDFLIPEK